MNSGLQICLIIKSHTDMGYLYINLSDLWVCLLLVIIYKNHPKLDPILIESCIMKMLARYIYVESMLS